MRKIHLVLFCFLLPYCLIAQSNKKVKSKVSKDSIKSVSKNTTTLDYTNKELSIKNYLILSKKADTTHTDTTLSIKKEYKYNYLRRDNFNLIQFANTGQTYNTLSFNTSSQSTKPGFAAQARHFNYFNSDDIYYYNVPTPLTELYFKTVFSQGQNLDAFFTVNTSKRLNFSIAYKGLRSLGNYQNALTSTGNFRITTNYKTKNQRYNMQGHITMQDLLNQENGGLTNDDVLRFKDGEEEIRDRSVFDPNFQNAENNLEGKRFYLNHSYSITRPTDSIKNHSFLINNTISFEDKFYQFNQDAMANDFFGDAFNNVINDKVTLEDFYSDLGFLYRNRILGNIGFKLNYTNINYGYNSLVVLNNQIITNRIKEDFFGFEGNYHNKLGRISLDGAFGANLSDKIKGNFIDVNLSYQLSKKTKLKGGLNINSRLPNYNHLLNQSDYTNYNWDNQNTFDTVNSQQLFLTINSDDYLNATVDINNINNYTFFESSVGLDNALIVKPAQYTKSIQYLRFKLQKEFKFGKFALDNTILYQNVTSDDDVLNVPSLITRNTFYYTDEVFKKALKFQTGIIFNYFSKYNGNGYDPLLAEFYTQNRTEIGGFPRLDFFVNAKIRQTRIYIKAEHFNSSFTGYDYFSAPNYPYRDFTIRFGLVWNFFL